MLRKLRLRLTYANAVSTMALFLALGGVSYAAVALPKNSVGSKQIKKNAVTAAKVKNGSLVPDDFKKGRLPSGARGAQGSEGAPGPQGVHGLQGKTGATGPSGTSGAHLVTGEYTTLAAVGDIGTATVTCPTGERVLGGGFTLADGLPNITVFRTEIIDAGTTLYADGKNVSSPDRMFRVYAICAA